MGFRLQVGSLVDGSDHAQLVLRIYGEIRDEMLASFDYDFAERTVALTQLKAAPPGGYFPPNLWNPANNPPMGFSYEYAWPDNALKIRSLKPSALFPVNMDPRPQKFSEYNDNNFNPPQRTIVTNLPGAIAVYTGRITDPTTWDVRFSDALASRLAVALAPALAPQSVNVTGPESQVSEAQAMEDAR